MGSQQKTIQDIFQPKISQQVLDDGEELSFTKKKHSKSNKQDESLKGQDKGQLLKQQMEHLNNLLSKETEKKHVLENKIKYLEEQKGQSQYQHDELKLKFSQLQKVLAQEQFESGEFQKLSVKLAQAISKYDFALRQLHKDRLRQDLANNNNSNNSLQQQNTQQLRSTEPSYQSKKSFIRLFNRQSNKSKKDSAQKSNISDDDLENSFDNKNQFASSNIAEPPDDSKNFNNTEAQVFKEDEFLEQVLSPRSLAFYFESLKVDESQFKLKAYRDQMGLSQSKNALSGPTSTGGTHYTTSNTNTVNSDLAVPYTSAHHKPASNITAHSNTLNNPLSSSHQSSILNSSQNIQLSNAGDRSSNNLLDSHPRLSGSSLVKEQAYRANRESVTSSFGILNALGGASINDLKNQKNSRGNLDQMGRQSRNNVSSSNRKGKLGLDQRKFSKEDDEAMVGHEEYLRKDYTSIDKQNQKKQPNISQADQQYRKSNSSQGAKPPKSPSPQSYQQSTNKSQAAPFSRSSKKHVHSDQEQSRLSQPKELTYQDQTLIDDGNQATQYNKQVDSKQQTQGRSASTYIDPNGSRQDITRVSMQKKQIMKEKEDRFMKQQSQAYVQGQQAPDQNVIMPGTQQLQGLQENFQNMNQGLDGRSFPSQQYNSFNQNFSFSGQQNPNRNWSRASTHKQSQVPIQMQGFQANSYSNLPQAQAYNYQQKLYGQQFGEPQSLPSHEHPHSFSGFQDGGYAQASSYKY